MSTGNGRTVMVQGRIVWTAGDLFKGELQKDFNTKQPKMNAAGEQVRQYGFGLAVPKSVLNQTAQGQPGEIWAAMHEEAFTLFPSRQIPPSFAMKYKDGDGVDDKGISFAQREGYAQHLVFACTTSLPIKFFKYENGQNILINEGIKCGDYVNVQLNIKAHPAIGQGKAGLYMNPNAVQFLGYGKEIINTPSGDQIFGTTAPPQLGSPTPIAPQGMLVPTGAPAPGYAQPAMQPPTPAAYQQPPQPGVQPHYGVVPQHLQPQATPQMAPVPQAPPTTYQQPAQPQYAQPAAPQGFPQPGMPAYR